MASFKLSLQVPFFLREAMSVARAIYGLILSRTGQDASWEPFNFPMTIRGGVRQPSSEHDSDQRRSAWVYVFFPSGTSIWVQLRDAQDSSSFGEYWVVTKVIARYYPKGMPTRDEGGKVEEIWESDKLAQSSKLWRYHPHSEPRPAEGEL